MGPVVENTPTNARDTETWVWAPGREDPCRRKWQCNRGGNYFHVKNNLKNIKKHGLPIMALGFEQTHYGWGQLPLVIIRLASRVIRECFITNATKTIENVQEHLAPCSVPCSQSRSEPQGQSRQRSWKDDLISSLKNNGTFYSSLQYTEDFEVKCPVIQTQKPAGKSYWRVQISDQHKEQLTIWAPEEGSFPTLQRSVLTLEDHLSRRLMKEWSSLAAKAVLSNM